MVPITSYTSPNDPTESYVRVDFYKCRPGDRYSSSVQHVSDGPCLAADVGEISAILLSSRAAAVSLARCTGCCCCGCSSKHYRAHP
uniref:Uncharacterized protein n=1 Tax=Arundo donax TaxID=35708 RepID=A0A0A9C9U5_ARUDO